MSTIRPFAGVAGTVGAVSAMIFAGTKPPCLAALQSRLAPGETSAARSSAMSAICHGVSLSTISLEAPASSLGQSAASRHQTTADVGQSPRPPVVQLSTAFMAVHKDSFTSHNITQGGLHRRKTLVERTPVWLPDNGRDNSRLHHQPRRRNAREDKDWLDEISIGLDKTAVLGRGISMKTE
jgi:hypothetical protein